MIINWGAVGAIGALLGALGVILTLFYLARQIRESNKASRQAAIQEVLNRNTDVMTQITSTVHTANVWMRGISDKKIEREDEIFFFAVLYSNILLWERMFFLHEDGLLDEWIWDDVSRQIDSRVGSKRFQGWFNSFKSDFYNDRWRIFLEGRIERANLKVQLKLEAELGDTAQIN